MMKPLEHKIVIIFLSISLNMCFWCSKELSHRAHNMFQLRNKKIIFPLHTLIWKPVWQGGINPCPADSIIRKYIFWYIYLKKYGSRSLADQNLHCYYSYNGNYEFNT